VAKRVQTILIDDLDGGTAEETVKFGLDGVQYEIDLSQGNAGALRDALASYVAAAQKVSGRATGQSARVSAGRQRGAAASDRDQNKAIRDWAKRKGIEISDRGRIKQEIVDQYHAEAGR